MAERSSKDERAAPEAAEVHLDWLLEVGHPGGEYAMALRTIEDRGPTADELSTLRRLESAYPTELLGLSEGSRSSVHFKRGLWNAVEQRGPNWTFMELLDSPMGLLVEELTLDAQVAESMEFGAPLRALLEGRARPFLRFLSVHQDRWHSPECQLEVPVRLGRVAPNLDHLQLSSGRLLLAPEALVGLERLRSLTIDGELRGPVIEALGRARFPALETLRLTAVAGTDEDVAADRLTTLLNGELAPRLRSIWLHDFEPPAFGNGVVDLLLHSPLLPRLRFVSLFGSDTDPASEATLRASARDAGNTTLTTFGFHPVRRRAGSRLDGTYDASDIQVLEGLQPIRFRPRMYIGDASVRGIQRLLCGLVTEFALADDATSVGLELSQGGARIDVGPRRSGAPPAIARDLERWLARLFGSDGNVELTCLNALSEEFTAEVVEDGRATRLSYRFGSEAAAPTSEGASGPNRVTFDFTLDPGIFSRRDFDIAAVRATLRQLSHLVPTVQLSLCDRRTLERTTFRSEGLAELLGTLLGERVALHPPILQTGGREGVRVDVALQCSRSAGPGTFLSFANGLPTPRGGTHLTGSQEALAGAAGRAGPPLTGSEGLGDDAAGRLPGLLLVVHAFLEQPRLSRDEWAGEVLALENPEAAAVAAEVTREAVDRLIASHPPLAQGLFASPQPSERLGG